MISASAVGERSEPEATSMLRLVPTSVYSGESAMWKSGSRERAFMDQSIHFCTTADGVRIAYTTNGSGLPLVRVIGWLTHLEFEEGGPFWASWQQSLAQQHCFIRYDGRGTGLSDRDVPDLSVAGKVRD